MPRPLGVDFLLILLILFIITHKSGFAQQVNDSMIMRLRNMSLEELMNVKVLSSTRSPEPHFTAPSVMYVIKKCDIEDKGYSNLQEALEGTPLFDWERPQGGWVGEYPRLRGVRALRQVLVMVDGIVQNTITEAEMARLHSFDLFTAKRIEIITGPASALYGANALLGVINIITEKPKESGLAKAAIQYGSDIGNAMFSYNRLKINAATGNKLKSGVSYLIDVGYEASDDQGLNCYDPYNLFTEGYYHDVYGDSLLVHNNGFDNHKDNFYTKIRLKSRENFMFGIDYVDVDEGIGSYLHGSRYFVNSNQYDYKWHTSRLSTFMRYKLEVNDKLWIEPLLYYRADRIFDETSFSYTVERTSTNEFLLPPGMPRHFLQHAYRAGGELSVHYQPIKNLDLLAGIVYEDDKTHNTFDKYGGFESDNNTIIYEEGAPYGDTSLFETYPFAQAEPMFFINRYSAYLQAIYNVNDNVKFVGSARYDKESDVDEEVSPRLGLVYETNDLLFSEDLIIGKLLYGQSFRALPIYQKYNMGLLKESTTSIQK